MQCAVLWGREEEEVDPPPKDGARAGLCLSFSPALPLPYSPSPPPTKVAPPREWRSFSGLRNPGLALGPHCLLKIMQTTEVILNFLVAILKSKTCN